MANIKKTSVVRPTQIGSGVFDRRTGAPITTPLKGDLKSQTTEAFSFNKNNYNPADEQTAFDSNPTDASYDAPGGKFIYDSKTGKRTNLGSMVVPEFKVKKGRKPKTKDTPHKQDGSFETLNIYNPEGVPFTRKELFDKRMDLLREDNSRIPLLLEDITADLPESDPRINLKGFVKDYGDEVDYKDSQLGVKKMPNEKIAELGYLIKKRALDESGDQKGPFKVLSGLTEEFDLETIGKFYEQFLEGIGKNLKGVPNPADLGVYWCAAFVNHILTELGADTLGKRGRYKRGRATEYMTYGKNIYTRSKEKPFNFDSLQEGDIVIFDYNGNNEGDHVAFYAGKDNFGGQKKGYINVVGGNHRATYGDDDPALSEGRLYVDDYGRDLRAPKIINPSGQQSERVVGVSVKRNTYRVGNVLGVRRITYNKDAATITEDQQNRGIHNVFDHLSRLTRLGRPLPTAEFKDTTTKTYAKGGLADMNTQTQMAFALGGEAETVDPVSGNDVPPGSLPEEVRDDIDAKLSEGEYVVPADVVRYYGVKFFENLRSKAKQGLQQMDEDGRIGGEPTSEMSLPFDISELEVEDEGGMRMAVGGLVAEYNVGGYQQASGVGSSFGGYGGDTGYKPYVQPVTTTALPPVVTTTAPAPANTGSQLKTYYDKMGNPVSVMFINGKPQQSLQGLTTSNPNASGDSGPVNVNLGNAPIGASAATTDAKGNALYKPGSSALEVATTGIDQLAKNTESGLSLGRIFTAGIGFVANKFFPGSGLLAGSLFKSGSDAENYSSALVGQKILDQQRGNVVSKNKAGKNIYENPSINDQYDNLTTAINNYRSKNQTVVEKIMNGIMPGDIEEKVAAFFKEVPKIAENNNIEPVKFGGTNWGGEGPTKADIAKGKDPKATFAPNTYGTTAVEKFLGRTSVPRKEARGSDGQAVNKPAKDLNWNEVQQLRSHSSVANRNKLADWNDHVKNGTATSAGKDGNSGSGDSDRVICTELYKQGKLDRELYRMDVMYTARHLSDTTVRGYHYWAVPMVTRMRTSTFLTNVFKYLTVARAKEIAYIVKPEKHKERSLLGYLIKNVGEAICFSIGLFVVQKDWTALYKGNKQHGN